MEEGPLYNKKIVYITCIYLTVKEKNNIKMLKGKTYPLSVSYAKKKHSFI